MLIRLNHVSKSFGSHLVLDNVCFQLNSGEKVGLVGKNGSGKTTLFRIISGELAADRGELTKHPQVKIGFMRQMVECESNNSLFDEAVSVFSSVEALGREIGTLEAELGTKAHHSNLQSLLDHYAQLQTRWELEGGYSYESQTKSVLFGLGFNESDLGKKISELSGGELNRLNLAKLLLSTPNALLLDEPTNHLDIAAVEWLENFLEGYPHAFLLISHDRFLLDATVNKVIEIDNGRLEEFSGNYSWYAEEREKRWLSRLKAYGQQQEFIEKTEEFIRRNIAGQKTKQAQSRRRMLEKLERINPTPSGKSQAKFRFCLNTQSGDLVFRISDLDVGYEGKTVVRQINLAVFRGERVGILGPNGSGKTTLLKTMQNLQAPLRGEVLTGHNVKIAFYDQKLSDLNPKRTLLEEMRLLAPFQTDEALRSYLASFLFQGDDVFQSVSTLSGGEKSRLALAKLILSQANTLLLDEPTNHLDIASCETIEAALESFPGTLIIVSHDRYLLKRLAERIVYLDGEGNFHYFSGGYEEFEAFHADERSTPTQLSSFKSSKVGRLWKSSPSPNKLSKNELNKIRSLCVSLEDEIQDLEKQIEVTSTQLSEPSVAKDYLLFKQLSIRYQELNSRLQQVYSEWERSLAILERQSDVLSHL